LALLVLAQVRARSGDPQAQEPLNEARDLARQTAEFQDIAPVAVARAEASWLNGDMDACVAEARPGYDLALTLGDRWFLGELSFWMWRGGELQAPPPGIAEPFALQMTGDWRAAATEWERLGCPYEHAMALADGDEGARKRAILIFEQLGARPAAEIVRRELKAKGARAIPRGPRASTKSNPASLTARELEVLALLASGLQNAEIAGRLYLSPKTVGHHVSAVLAKLSARSRRDAVSTAYRLGIIESPH
jgi:DNA-binding CsgD family transcriptional regulator